MTWPMQSILWLSKCQNEQIFSIISNVYQRKSPFMAASWKLKQVSWHKNSNTFCSISRPAKLTSYRTSSSPYLVNNRSFAKQLTVVIDQNKPQVTTASVNFRSISRAYFHTYLISIIYLSMSSEWAGNRRNKLLLWCFLLQINNLFTVTSAILANAFNSKLSMLIRAII